MPSILCPRCQEPFGAKEKTCKRCGIVKGVQFFKLGWWSVTILLAPLVSVCVAEIIVALWGIHLDMFGVSYWAVQPFFLLSFCLYKAHLYALLRKRGIVTKGIVSKHRKVRREIWSEYHTAYYYDWRPVIRFKADITPPLTCHIVEQFSSAKKFPIGSQQDVIYDPYDPQGNCRIGKRLSVSEQVVWIVAVIFALGIIVWTFLSLF